MGEIIMKTNMFVFTIAATLAGLLIISAGVLAARPPGAGNGGGGGGDTGTDPPDYGDLIILLRTDNGVPIPSSETLVEDPETGLLVDGGLCWQPIAFNVDDALACPEACQVTTTTPATVSVNQYNCGVEDGCSGCTQEVEFGRINEVRAPDTVFASQLEDVVVNLATADCITLDPAGRLVASRVVGDEVTTSTIDSPLQNLSIFRQLMMVGYLGDATSPIALPADVLDTAARGLGVAADKTGEVNVDMVAYLNSNMGLDVVPTILDPKLCETYREEVQGTIQLVEKCYLDYRSYGYDRTTNFSALPAPAYIPAGDNLDGWFEYLALLPGSELDPLFIIMQGPILPPVFDVDPGFMNGNIGGFAQASDDTRAVINFMHDWPMPDADVYGTPVPCIADPDLIAYDVLISEDSGLQVPAQMVDGSEGREFFVTVANASSSTDPATGTVTVTAIAEAGGPIEGSPWAFPFEDLAPGASQNWTTFFTIDLGQRTTINWTAVAAAPDDVNYSNNTVTATTSVKVTGGGGGGGKP